MHPMTTTTREEEVLILFGSQRGTGEDVAESIAKQIPEKLSAGAIQALTGNDSVSITVLPRVVGLDDWLLDHHAKWERLVIIILSSFGMGDAPMNARQFRRRCDALTKEFKADENKPKFLEGVHFALLGLGDSDYKTYLKNPNVAKQFLTLAGATQIVELGEADAKEGPAEQKKAIVEWVDGIWSKLAQILVKDPSMSEEQLAEAQKQTEA